MSLERGSLIPYYCKQLINFDSRHSNVSPWIYRMKKNEPNIVERSILHIFQLKVLYRAGFGIGLGGSFQLMQNILLSAANIYFEHTLKE